MRNPVVAGMFYPAGKEELLQTLESLFKEAEKTAEKFKAKTSIKSKQVFGIIAPHAGYAYSGKCAAVAYFAFNIKQTKKQPKTFILLGPNHSGYGADIAISLEDFSTPLGVVKNNAKLSKEVLKSRIVEQSEQAHMHEHSLEVQLPFLQYLFDNNFQIVPILIKNYNLDICKQLAKFIYDSIKKLKLNPKNEIFIIASSDFTHYGTNYGFLPFTENVKENLYKLDSKAIEQIEKMQTQDFLNFAEKTTICGAGAIATAIDLCKMLGAKKAKKLCYYTSGDIVGDYSNSVGYAGIAFIS